MMRSGLLYRGRCFTQINTGPMEKDHPGWKHLNASLRDKVEILAKNPYRFYIYPNVWTFRGPSRLEILSQFMAEAEAAEDFELCARILEVEKALACQIFAS